MNAPLGIRFNNPWNLQQEHIPWLGLTPNQSPSGELQFDTMEDGIRAGVKLCYSYQQRGWNTVDRFVANFSPENAGNPTVQYEENLCAWGGWQHSETLDFRDAAVMQMFARAVWRQENGLDALMAINTDQINAGIAMAGGEH